MLLLLPTKASQACGSLTFSSVEMLGYQAIVTQVPKQAPTLLCRHHCFTSDSIPASFATIHDIHTARRQGDLSVGQVLNIAPWHAMGVPGSSGLWAFMLSGPNPGRRNANRSENITWRGTPDPSPTTILAAVSAAEISGLGRRV